MRRVEGLRRVFKGGWPSGLWRRFAKSLAAQAVRRFKSCASRQFTASDIAVYVEIVWRPGKTGRYCHSPTAGHRFRKPGIGSSILTGSSLPTWFNGQKTGFVNLGSGFDSLRRLHRAGPWMGRVYPTDPRSPRGLSCRTPAGSIPAFGSSSMTGGMYGAERGQVWQVDLLPERRREAPVAVQRMREGLQARPPRQEILLELRQQEHEGELDHDQQ